MPRCAKMFSSIGVLVAGSIPTRYSPDLSLTKSVQGSPPWPPTAARRGSLRKYEALDGIRPERLLIGKSNPQKAKVRYVLGTQMPEILATRGVAGLDSAPGLQSPADSCARLLANLLVKYFGRAKGESICTVSHLRFNLAVRRLYYSNLHSCLSSPRTGSPILNFSITKRSSYKNVSMTRL